MADMTPNANLRALLARFRMDRHEAAALTGAKSHPPATGDED